MVLARERKIVHRVAHFYRGMLRASNRCFDPVTSLCGMIHCALHKQISLIKFYLEKRLRNLSQFLPQILFHDFVWGERPREEVLREGLFVRC